jgi:hypothetical protein
MSHSHFWGGIAVGVLFIAAFTRFTVPVLTKIANTVANKS